MGLSILETDDIKTNNCARDGSIKPITYIASRVDAASSSRSDTRSSL